MRCSDGRRWRGPCGQRQRLREPAPGAHARRRVQRVRRPVYHDAGACAQAVERATGVPPRLALGCRAERPRRSISGSRPCGARPRVTTQRPRTPSGSNSGPGSEMGYRDGPKRRDGLLASGTATRIPYPNADVHEVPSDVGGAGCGVQKACLSCQANSIMRSLRFSVPGSIWTFWQMSA